MDPMLFAYITGVLAGGVVGAVFAWTARGERAEARIEALERERVAYLGAILPEGPDAVNRITTRIVDMRDEITTELAEGLAALAAGKNPA